MMTFDKTAIGVDQGEEVLFSDYEDGGEMWTGSGTRERRRHVAFGTAFKSPPVVHLSLSLWDMDSATNARADMEADKITETGFDVAFRTWDDTRIARIRVRWLAIGEAYHEDEWQLY